MKRLAKPWDVVTCRNNHPMFLAITSINAEEPLDTRHFTPFNGVEASIHRAVCPVCQEFATYGFTSETKPALYVRGKLRAYDYVYLDNTDEIIRHEKLTVSLMGINDE